MSDLLDRKDGCVPLAVPEDGEFALFLGEESGETARPWAENGVICLCYDIKNPLYGRREGNIYFLRGDFLHLRPPMRNYVFACAMPDCTHLTGSGAKHFRQKGLRARADALHMVGACEEILHSIGAPGFIENPKGILTRLWRKWDYKFDPCDYTQFNPDDNYTKETHIWAFGDFVMPPYARDSSLGPPDDRIHKAPRSAKRGAERSVTPAGFASANFLANRRQIGKVRAA